MWAALLYLVLAKCSSIRASATAAQTWAVSAPLVGGGALGSRTAPWAEGTAHTPGWRPIGGRRVPAQCSAAGILRAPSFTTHLGHGRASEPRVPVVIEAKVAEASARSSLVDHLSALAEFGRSNPQLAAVCAQPSA